MNKKSRDRLLGLASRLDRWALRIRKYCRERTPKRARKVSGSNVERVDSSGKIGFMLEDGQVKKQAEQEVAA